MNGLGVGHGTLSAREEAELREELAAAARLGHRRRRRRASDRLLRELGGRMSVAEMQAQFMPPPFGAPAKPTAFEAMLDAQARGEWTGFHKVDMDKEKAFLDKVRAAEAASRTHRHESESYAAAGWARMSARARAALRSVARRSPERLEDLENVILDFAEEFSSTGRELVLRWTTASAGCSRTGCASFTACPRRRGRRNGATRNSSCGLRASRASPGGIRSRRRATTTTTTRRRGGRAPSPRGGGHRRRARSFFGFWSAAAAGSLE